MWLWGLFLCITFSVCILYTVEGPLTDASHKQMLTLTLTHTNRVHFYLVGQHLSWAKTLRSQGCPLVGFSLLVYMIHWYFSFVQCFYFSFLVRLKWRILSFLLNLKKPAKRMLKSTAWIQRASENWTQATTFDL